MGKHAIPRRITLALAFAVLVVLVTEAIYGASLRVMFTSVLSLLLVDAYFWWLYGRRPRKDKMFWIAIEASLIFLAGAAYGLVQSIAQGWQWTDLIGLGWALVMACVSLCFAFRVRRGAGA